VTDGGERRLGAGRSQNAVRFRTAAGSVEIQALKIVTLLVIAVAMALALAHALEMPGKMRLSREQYQTVQAIYYPGFTIGGIAEPIGLVLLLLLLVWTPYGSNAFSLFAASFAVLAVMHASYWLFTHPVNNFWLKGVKLPPVSRDFFSFVPFGRVNEVRAAWTTLRDRWEYSHALRAALGMTSLAFMAAGLTQ
jgi:hypothetical protein